MMDNRYYISSNGESGEGRYDIQLLPKTENMPGILIELKAARNFSGDKLSNPGRMEGPAPRPGQLTLWAVQSVVQGADFISFFRWRTCTVGSENYWHGILDYDNEWDTEVDVWHRRVAEKSEKEIFVASELYHTPYDIVYLQKDSELSDLTEYPAEENVWAKLQGCKGKDVIEMPIFNDILEPLDGTEVLAVYGNSYYTGKVAVTEKKLGDGKAIHFGSTFSKNNLNWMFEYLRLDICGFAGALLPGTGIYYLTPAKRRSIA